MPSLVEVRREKNGVAPSRNSQVTPFPGFPVWVTSPGVGHLRSQVTTGQMVQKGDRLGVIYDPFNDIELDVFSPFSGRVSLRSRLPLVNNGDRLFQIARD